MNKVLEIINNMEKIMIGKRNVVERLTIASVIALISFKLTKRPRCLKKVLKMTNEKAFEELIRDSVNLLEKCDMRPYEGETELVFE